MDIRHMRYFETVARVGNMTKAAEELNIAQPPLSQQIQAFEKIVGVKLFHRSKKGVSLTEEGELLLQRIGPLIRQFEELNQYIAGIRDSAIGNLTIATLPGLSRILSKALHQVWMENPMTHIFLREGQSKLNISLVQSREAHIGISRLPILASELNYTILGNDPIRVIVREDDPLSGKERIYPEDLRDRKLLLIRSSTDHSSFIQIVRLLEEQGCTPNIIGHMETAATLLQMVKCGPGIGLIPETGMSLAPAKLKAIPFGETDIYIPTAVIWLKNETNPLVLKIKNMIVKYCTF